MVHAHTLAGQQPERRSGFTVSATAIPLGVLCRGCGRLLLPARLWPLAIRSRPRGRTEVELRCVRCNSVGSLLLDRDDLDHRGLLVMWDAARPEGSETDDDPERRGPK